MRWILAILMLTIGLLVGLLMPPHSEQTSSPATVDQARLDNRITAAAPIAQADLLRLRQDLEAIQQTLSSEIGARRKLESQIIELRGEVDGLQANEQLDAIADLPAADSDTELAEPQGWFNRQALLDIGFDAMQADEMKNHFEQIEIERLYLRDTAERNDWDREQLREAMRELGNRESDLKNRLGEAAYDAYLYASGQTNRVAVASLLETAPAASAGIRSGDHIIRYDNMRIYNWNDLRGAISGGEIGDSVKLEIERDGKRLEFYLDRGPMGIRTTSLSLTPQK